MGLLPVPILCMGAWFVLAVRDYLRFSDLHRVAAYLEEQNPNLGFAIRSALEADEVLVVHGGSQAATKAVAVSAGAAVLGSERGRGNQLNRGAAASSGDLLLFLHADTLLPAGFAAELRALMTSADAGWGRFDVRFDRGGPLLRLIAWLISTRSRVTRGAASVSTRAPSRSRQSSRW